MASYTSNYQLHQWVPEDDFLRSDFNEDFQKIDAGIAAALAAAGDKAEIVTGAYTGNGSSQTINLGFQPRAVYVESSTGVRDLGGTHGGLALQNSALAGRDGGTAVQITANGFQAHQDTGDSAFTNGSGRGYYYLAVK